MRRVHVSLPAKQDRFELWLHIACDNQDAADRFIEEIDEKLRLLAASPSLGRARPDIGQGVRYFPVGNYLIFYAAAPDGINVLRILHGARRIKDFI